MDPHDPGFTLDVNPREDGGTRVAVAGELDLAVAPEFRRLLTEQLAAGPVLLDLRELSFMDSSGVQVLDALLRACAEEGWTLRVSAALQRPVRQVLEMTGMIDLLTFAEAETT